MKKLIFILAFLCHYVICQSQSRTKLRDGLYLVAEVVKDSTILNRSAETRFIHFNALFLENAPDSTQGLLIFRKEYVPLELSEEPTLMDQTENKKKIQLSFSRMAAHQLAAFTEKHKMKHVALIVDGEALTLHMIRTAITGGKMEITRCDDNACQKIYVQLKDNVK